jgi:hypothetical protein
VRSKLAPGRQCCSSVSAAEPRLPEVSSEPNLRPFTYPDTRSADTQWLPRMATGEIRAAFSLSEPELGSDVAAIKTAENLLVCDGAAVPANVGVNPSLTITARAEHAMSHIPPAGGELAAAELVAEAA